MRDCQRNADSNTQWHSNKIRTNPLTQNRSKHCVQLRSPQSSPTGPHEVLAGVLTSASAPQSPKFSQVFEQQVALVQLPPARVLQGADARFGSGVNPSTLHTSEEAQVGTQQMSEVPWKSALWNQPLHRGQPQPASFPIRNRTSFYHS